jgi:glycosyltransferase involved in cell wall biosynthesis
MKKLALCMIVKNESHIIRECLNSVANIVDYWVICDTGSTDGTQEIIKTFFQEKGIPGELHEREWKGFGHNRTEAFKLCEGKAEYAFVIDADDYVDGNLVIPKNMTSDAYAVRMGRPEFSWWRNQIFRLDAKWSYVGVLHEYAACEKQNPIVQKLEGNYRVVARTLGARNKDITPIEKYKKDAEVLEKALVDEPTNSRYQFYLAQSYFDSQQYDKAETAYIKRAEMGGWAEEVYYSIYRVAIAKALQNKPWPEVQQTFLDAYNYRPTRAEPLYHIAQVYRQKFNMPVLAYMFAKAAMDIPFPEQDILFVPDIVYNFGILDEISATAFYAGHPMVGYIATEKLLKSGKIPPDELPRIQKNFEQYQKVIDQMVEQGLLENPQKNQPSPIKKKTFKKRIKA